MLLSSWPPVFEVLEGVSALDQEFLSLTGHLMNLINTFCILPVQLVECELCVQDRQNMMCGVGNKIIVCLVPGLHLALKKIVEDERRDEQKVLQV